MLVLLWKYPMEAHTGNVYMFIPSFTLYVLSPDWRGIFLSRQRGQARRGIGGTGAAAWVKISPPPAFAFDACIYMKTCR